MHYRMGIASNHCNNIVLNSVSSVRNIFITSLLNHFTKCINGMYILYISLHEHCAECSFQVALLVTSFFFKVLLID